MVRVYVYLSIAAARLPKCTGRGIRVVIACLAQLQGQVHAQAKEGDFIVFPLIAPLTGLGDDA